MPDSLDTTLGYMLAQACKFHKSAIASKFQQIGLYTGQEMILNHLEKHGQVAHNDLAEAVGIKPPTLTTVLGRMEKNDLVQRSKSEQDKRIQLVSITSKGKKVQKEVIGLWMQVEETTFDSFSLEEKILLKRLFQQIVDNLQL